MFVVVIFNVCCNIYCYGIEFCVLCSSLFMSRAFYCVQYATPEKPLSSIEKQQIEIVKLLVEKGAQLNVEDLSGDTPMDLASKNDFAKCWKVMEELNS